MPYSHSTITITTYPKERRPFQQAMRSFSGRHTPLSAPTQGPGRKNRFHGVGRALREEVALRTVKKEQGRLKANEAKFP